MIFGVPLAFLFIFASLRATFQSIIWLFQWKRSQEWPSTRGRIIQSNLESRLVPRGGRKSQNFDGSVRLVTAFTPNILYEYRVNAEAFQSKQLFLGQQFPASFHVSDDLVEKYPIGKEVTVFYDPDKPAFAVLELDRFKVLLGYLGGSLLFILFGFMFLVQVLQQR